MGVCQYVDMIVLFEMFLKECLDHVILVILFGWNEIAQAVQSENFTFC